MIKTPKDRKDINFDFINDYNAEEFHLAADPRSSERRDAIMAELEKVLRPFEVERLMKYYDVDNEGYKKKEVVEKYQMDGY